jgi:outer membrane protein TolC
MKIASANILFCLLFPLLKVTAADAQQSFDSVDALFDYANQKSTVLRSDSLKLDQAKKAKLAALLAIPDLNANVGLNVTDNTKLPVSVFPAEAFGGAPGTYREVQTGIQYTNNFNQYAEVKLINASGWQNYKLAGINISATNIDNKISKKTLYENIASCYYNVVTLQAQLASTDENIKVSDTILQIVTNKYDAGIARQQDVNDAQASYINATESSRQIQSMIASQYLALKILCDIPESEDILISELPGNSKGIEPILSVNELNYQSSLNKQQYALTSYKQLKHTMLPSLNAFGSNSNQQFSNSFNLFDQHANWINSNYIGLKLVWQIPTANTIAQISKAKYDHLASVESAQHQQLKANLDHQQLKIDYGKSVSQAISNKKVAGIREDSYRRNLENYKEGIIPLDKLLLSYNEMINSNYTSISASVNVQLTEAKIKIYNTIR